jgi:hypothetical protein
MLKLLKVKRILMKLFFKIVILTFLVCPALAQNKVGNGGDVVDCKKSTTRLLDFYEAKIEFNSKDTNHIVIAENHLAKLKDIAPRLATQYMNRLKNIEPEIDFKADVKLTDIKDSLHLYEPLSKDCKVYQIAIRRSMVVGDEKRFIIRKDLWDKLPPTHKAGLLTHEIIYEHLSKLGESDSIKARKLNVHLFSNDLKKESFWKLIKDLELPIYPQ